MHFDAVAATPAPKLEIIPWTDATLPYVFGPADTLARRSFPPDSLADASRPRLAAAFAERPCQLDGKLDDWRLVRWNDLTGAGSLLRGRESGAQDLGVKFALAWEAQGLWLGAHVDARTAPGDIAPLLHQPAVTVAFANSAPLVQRYWMGSARRLRIRADGGIEASTDMRNRRPERFDASALGVRAVTTPRAERNGFDLELFVPWSALYPALPGQPGALLANVFVEDGEAGSGRLAAWSIAGTPPASRPAWARIDWGTPPASGTWLAALATPHPEIACEWVLVPWGAASGGDIEVRGKGAASGWKPQRARVSRAAPMLVRLGGLPLPRRSGIEARRIDLDWHAPGDKTPRTWSLTLPPTDADLQSASVPAALHAPAPAAFASPEDIAVRIIRARQRATALGAWRDRKYHATGILAWRSAEWSRVEELLHEADVLRAAAAADGDAATVRARLAPVWPVLGPELVPRGVAVQRATRSIVDGSVQPYALYVPAAVQAGAPLLVVLHDLDEDEWNPLETTSVVAQCERRGWILLCPYGRGNVGYLTVGERDVLQAIDAVRAALPVDPRRIYLTGSGMGGTGTWLLALRHPDLFAAASVVAGYGDLEQSGIFDLLRYQASERAWYDAHNPVRLLGPGMTTAFRIAHSDRDAVVSPVHARIMHARMQELGAPHAYQLDLEGSHGPRYFDADLAPSFDFLAGHARREDGRVDATSWSAAGPPMTDVFARGPFAIVYGSRPGAISATATASEAVAPADDRGVAEQLAAEWQSRYGGVARVLADTDVTPELLQTTNLVLVGDPSTNAWLERWRDRLPVAMDGEAFVVATKGYPLAKYGLAYAAVSPESAQRSVVVLAGMPGGRLQLLPNTVFGFAAAYAIVNPTQGLIETGAALPPR